MRNKEFEIIASDGKKLFGRSWDPPDQVQGVVCLVHGLGEHIGRWDHVAELFCSAHIAFFGIDLRGHGRSQGRRGHTKSLNQLLDDIEDLLKVARREYMDLPIILYGHSMGGNLVANFILKRRTSEIQAVVMTSAWLKLAFTPPTWLMKVGRVMNWLWPTFQMDNGLHPSDLSNDPQVGEAYQADPLVHSKISVRMGSVGLDGAEWALRHSTPSDLPILITHGDEDRITSVEGSKLFHIANPDNSELLIWEGLKHELHNEIRKAEVLQSLLDWCRLRFDIKFSPATP